MKLPELKEKLKSKYIVRVVAGVLTIALVGTGIGATAVFAAICFACVPLPAPGAPNMMIFIKIFSFYTKLVDSTNGDTEFSISNVQLII